MVESDLTDRSVAVQDGLKHYMLCDECEGLLGAAEDYLCRLMTGSPREHERMGIRVDSGEAGQHLSFAGIQRDLVERALVGITFKAHFSSAREFRAVKLGDALLQRVRAFILRGTSLDVQIVAMRFVSNVAPGISADGMVLVGWDQTRRMLCLTAAGWEWATFLDFKETRFSGTELAAGRNFVVLVADITEHRTISPWQNRATDKLARG